MRNSERKSRRAVACRLPVAAHSHPAGPLARGVWIAAALLATLAAALLSAAPARATTEVVEHRLDNGMRVLVGVDRRSPVVVHQVWYKVGSSYEYGGISGASHALEHMMFKGTENLAPGEFSEIVARNGGRDNAFTSRDYTAYFQTVAADRLPLMMQLEAERMTGLRILDEEFSREMEVIKEERRMRTDDKPRSKLYEQFNALAFVSSPSRIPVIGWREDIDAMTADDLRAWYRRWYAPNNATLVVVGDVDPEAVIALAEQHYGDLPPREVAPPKPRREIPQRGERRFSLHVPAELPYLLIGFKVPSMGSLADAGSGETDIEAWEPYALDLLAGVLDGGESARFSRRLVRGAQLASQAGAGYDLYDRGEGLFIIDGTPAAGTSLDELERALLAQIDELIEHGVDDAELDRVKARIIAEDVYQRDSMFYSAMRLGILETVGLGHQRLDEYIPGVRAVTAEQVQAVARKYLRAERRTVGHLLPQQEAAANAAEEGAQRG